MNRLSAVTGAVALVAAVNTAGAQSTATYELKFTSNWSTPTFPSTPITAHWSSLVGATHSPAAVFWQPGGLASPGIKNMSELGSVFPLTLEIDNQVAAGNALKWFTGPANGAVATVTMTFQATTDFPLATFVTMVAPSPDWFIGTHGLPLRDAGGWIPSIVHEAYPYDAGTDSGATYTSPDLPTLPPSPISALTNNHTLFTGTPAMGAFTFTLLSVSCVADCDTSGTLDFFDFLCFQNNFANGAPSADCDGNGTLDFFDFLCFQNSFQAGC